MTSLTHIMTLLWFMQSMTGVESKRASAKRLFRENKSLIKGECGESTCKVQNTKVYHRQKEMNMAALKELNSKTGDEKVGSLWEDMAEYDMPYAMDYVVGVTIEQEDGSREDYSCIMDTGSSNLGISTASCSECGVGESDLAIPYDESECIEVLYGDSTEDSTFWSGYETISTKVGFSAKDEKSVDLMTGTTFAAITNASTGDKEFFDGGYTGILGLAYSGIAESYYDCDSGTKNQEATPIIDALKQNKVIDDDIFSISYCGGSAELAIGSLDTTTFSGSMQYTASQKTFGEYYGYYLAEIEDWEIDGESLDVSSSEFNTYGGAVVDSGTTELILPVTAYVAMAKTILNKVTWLDSSFFSDEECITSSGLESMPDMTIKMSGDVSLTLPAKNYLISYDNCYYWGVSASSMTIIGNVAMQDLTVAFDRENSRIGFADVSSTICEGSETLKAQVNAEIGSLKGKDSNIMKSQVAEKIYGPKPRALAKRWPSMKKEAHAQLLIELDEAKSSTPSKSSYDMHAVGIFAIIGSLSVFGVFAIVYSRYRTYGSYERVNDFRI